MSRLILSRWLSWLPLALLLGAFIHHLWLVQRYDLSPWLGGGFGMFASTDVGSARQVLLLVELADGRDFQIDLVHPYRDTLERARGLPSPAWLARLARTGFEALEDTPEIQFPAPPRGLRIEVWRILAAAGTLNTRSEMITSARFPLPDDWSRD